MTPVAATQPELITEMELRPKTQPPSSTGLMLVIELLASRQDVDVAKLEKIIELHERVTRQQAEAEFNRAFAEMLPEVPTIIERAHTDKTTYAPLEDIVEPLRPILAKFGFSPSFRTEWPNEKTVRVVGILTHVSGHARTSEFMSAADATGSKNAIQALASAVSYGKRYTFKDLLCIVTRGEDDDGQSSEKAKQPDAPAGYEDWLLDMSAVAEEGWPKLSTAFGKSKLEYRKHLTGPDRVKWAALRGKAEKVK